MAFLRYVFSNIGHARVQIKINQDNPFLKREEKIGESYAFNCPEFKRLAVDYYYYYDENTNGLSQKHAKMLYNSAVAVILNVENWARVYFRIVCVDYVYLLFLLFALTRDFMTASLPLSMYDSPVFALLYNPSTYVTLASSEKKTTHHITI